MELDKKLCHPVCMQMPRDFLTSLTSESLLVNNGQLCSVEEEFLKASRLSSQKDINGRDCKFPSDEFLNGGGMAYLSQYRKLKKEAFLMSRHLEDVKKVVMKDLKRIALSFSATNGPLVKVLKKYSSGLPVTMDTINSFGISSEELLIMSATLSLNDRITQDAAGRFWCGSRLIAGN